MNNKYGKKVNMRSLKRDVNKIKQLIKDNDEFCSANLIHFNEKKEYDCRICHSKEIKKYINVKGYEYAKCSDCESIVLLNIPDVKKLYEKEGTPASTIYLDKDVFQKRVETIAIPKIEFILKVASVNKNIVWCDVGCGVGEVLAGLKQNYNGKIDGVGIEIDPAEIRFGREKGLNIVQGFIDPDNPSEEIIDIIRKADIVTMLNVLEHIEKPDEIINFYKKHMKKGSNLVLEVPRHPSLASFVNLASTSLTYRHIAPPVHLQVFSDNSIVKMTGGGGIHTGWYLGFWTGVYGYINKYDVTWKHFRKRII